MKSPNIQDRIMSSIEGMDKLDSSLGSSIFDGEEMASSPTKTSDIEQAILRAKDLTILRLESEIDLLKRQLSKVLQASTSKIRDLVEKGKELKSQVESLQSENAALRRTQRDKQVHDEELKALFQEEAHGRHGAHSPSTPSTLGGSRMFPAPTDAPSPSPAGDEALWKALFLSLQASASKQGGMDLSISPIPGSSRGCWTSLDPDDFELALNTAFFQRNRKQHISALSRSVTTVAKVMKALSTMLDIPGDLMDLNTLTNSLVRAVAMGLCGAAAGRIMVQQGDLLKLIAEVESEEDQSTRSKSRYLPLEGIAAKVIREGCDINCHPNADLLVLQAYSERVDGLQGDMRPFVCVPIFDEMGEIAGSLTLYSRPQPQGAPGRGFSEEDQIMCREFGKQCGKEFKQCEMFAASWRSQQMFNRFLRYTPVVNSKQDFVAILRIMMDMIANVISVSQTGVFLLDKDTSEFRLLHTCEGDGAA
eukprot:CAMPEP_0113720452 /NCGR_PEP_ID=MMETSP0038_2-20120614/36482_1 /TAXON_ID=2898 /ORGANISM="Cryptomonas paramecium" /LENGTH=476 /DNA_ID=CAMNT_0000649145 /DNA_START=234 /DNA_END=1663 /DNA_ORIENTATION=- /assembly_acc=CAM_ASM_000170